MFFSEKLSGRHSTSSSSLGNGSSGRRSGSPVGAFEAFARSKGVGGGGVSGSAPISLVVLTAFFSGGAGNLL